MFEPRPMRRSKQLLSKEDTISILERRTNGILSVVGDDNYPYGVPLSYIYHNNKIYFHCAKQGYKLDAIEKNPKVCFTVVDEDKIVAEEFTTYFRSVICFGTIAKVEDEKEFAMGHQILCDKYSANIPLPPHEKLAEEFRHMSMLVMDIEFMSGKEAIEFVKMRANT